MKPTYLAAAILLAFSTAPYALPQGGAVTAGGAAITGTPTKVTVTQSTQNVAINWQSFSIGATEAVQFVQPSSAAVALNRVIGQDPSAILGSLTANGKVYLVNPNGILFARGAQVNVGALVASTRNISDANFMAGNHKFEGSGSGSVVNEGTINAPGGSVALLGATVTNNGVIAARMGSVTLAAGNAFTLDVAGDGLLQVAVDRGAVDALVQNGGLIQADGGRVLLTAKSASTLLQSAVNNTGVIQAQTVENHAGVIRLMGDMVSGSVHAGGTLDASAPNGGSGGFIETSAADVRIADDVRISTRARDGNHGMFLIDPLDFNIGGVGSNISGLALGNLLVNGNVTITTVPGVAAFVDTQPEAVPSPTTNLNGGAGPGPGNINVREAVTWTPPVGTGTTTLTLNAFGDVNVDAGVAITGTRGNVVVCCGQNINVNGTISTTNGSVLLSAGNIITLAAAGAITTSDGNLTICAGRDINVFGAITVTNGSVTAGESLGLTRGLVLNAGNAGTTPAPASGTVNFGAIDATVTAAPTVITYNPVSYTLPTDYSLNIIGAAPTQFMLVYPEVANKVADGTTTATLTGFRTSATSGPVPGGVTLTGLGTANFDTPDAGVNKLVTFSGFTVTQGPIVAGPAAINFALPAACCGVAVGQTTGTINAAAVPVVPVVPVTPAVLTQAGLPPVQMPLPLFFPMIAGLNLDLGGITMPPIQVVQAPVELIPLPEVVPPPVFVAPPPPPPAYVPPRPIPRRDRN